LSLNNVPVLITGAGRGIGKRLALGFARAGARVGILGRNQAELDATKLEIEHAGGTALRLRADVRKYSELDTAVARLVSLWGPVEVLIANAGVVGPVGPFVTQNPDQWHEVIETNLFGVMNSVRVVLGSMVERRKGKVLVVSGTGAATPRPFFAPYAATKTAVVRFAESVAEEVREHNVQINSFFPGQAYTSMTDDILRASDALSEVEVQEAHNVRLTGGLPPDRQIQMALFLCSERSNHLTGKLIEITDNWKKLEQENTRPDAFTLRRHLK
jgi:NAD(P)-dependent dehydrogenase (short-subunit alcohol dehydrogenase family)